MCPAEYMGPGARCTQEWRGLAAYTQLARTSNRRCPHVVRRCNRHKTTNGSRRGASDSSGGRIIFIPSSRYDDDDPFIVLTETKFSSFEVQNVSTQTRGSDCLDVRHERSHGVCRVTVGQGVWYKEGGMPPAGKDVEPASQGPERGDRRA
jgi:hypothetical protein